jgi:hypothetical protein
MPLLLISPDTRRQLNTRAHERFGQGLEDLYASWAYWHRRRDWLRRQPFWIRHRVKLAIEEAKQHEDAVRERIQLLWAPRL